MLHECVYGEGRIRNASFISDMSISEGGGGMAQDMEAWGLDSGEGRTFLDT